MADIGNSVWDETDANNNTASPDGAPEGMAPSGVNNTIRADRGAIKRWYNWTLPKTTGGTSTAYTLSYGVAPGALVDGMTHLVQFNAINGASPTLNVNALGAKPLHFYLNGTWAALPANMLNVDQVVEVTYNSSAGTYRCIGLQPTLVQSPSAASTVDFTGIPANVNNIDVLFALTVGTNGANVQLQVYDSSASLDTSAVYASWQNTTLDSAANSPAASSGATSIQLAGTASNSATRPVKGRLHVTGIQDTASYTEVNWQLQYLDSGGSLSRGVIGYGLRTTAGRITGLRFSMSSGTFTGKVTVVMS